MTHFESSADAITNAISAATARGLTAYEVYVKKSPRAATQVAITFHQNPGELHTYWNARLHEYGNNARVVGYAALHGEVA
jgi:hypothetical protein